MYIHIPFCASKCDYCAFATWTDRGHLVDTYLDALRADIDATMGDGAIAASSVFVGGGTPSLVPAEGLAAVLRRVRLQPGAEVTVECNPETVTPALLDTYRGAGVNRLSFGVQSMVRAVLGALGRAHTPGTVDQAVAWARDAGFRIDHLLLSPVAADRLTDAGVDKDYRGREKASDHAPTWVTID